jgi:hypothetical protein
MKPPKYSIPPLVIAYLTLRIFTGRPQRPMAWDAAWARQMHTPSPTISGIEHIPRTGGVLIVANHYQRPGMWIGWGGGLIADAVNGVRPARAPVRIVVTDSQRVRWFGRERTLPLSGWFLRRIARAWEMIPIPADHENKAGQAAALRTSLNALNQNEVVLFFPEGERGNATGLIDALPGTGTFVALASRRAAIVPCGLWEEGEQLRGQFGAPLTLQGRDDEGVRRQVMAAIAAQIPGKLAD